MKQLGTLLMFFCLTFSIQAQSFYTEVKSGIGLQKAVDSRYGYSAFVPATLMLGWQLKHFQFGMQMIGNAAPAKYYIINPNSSDISVKESINEFAIGPYLRMSSNAMTLQRAAGFITFGADYCWSSRTAYALNTANFKVKESFQNAIATSADIGFSVPLIKNKLVLTSQYKVLFSTKSMYKFDMEIEHFHIFDHSVQLGLAWYFHQSAGPKSAVPASSKFE